MTQPAEFDAQSSGTMVRNASYAGGGGNTLSSSQQQQQQQQQQMGGGTLSQSGQMASVS
jgi:hypothetical protein